jgi:histone H3/H4
VALKEIKAIQKKSDDRVRKVAFLRLIREVSDEIRHEQSSEEPIFRWRRDAVSALQKATDALLVLLVGNLISAAVT